MSDHEQTVNLEQRSSVEIAQNAKGDPQVRVKLIVGQDPAEAERVADHAVRIWRATVARARGEAA